MRNNKGFMKHELITVILILLVIFAFLFYLFLGGLSKQKVETMKENAITFSKTIVTNIASFHNIDTVYLGEAIDEKLLDGIKSPVGGGDCSISESKVTFKDGNSLVTLRCGDYLIDSENVNATDKMKIYKVGKWEEKKLENGEEKTLYNCKKDDKLVYDEYYEEFYFVSRINKDNDTDYYFAKDIKDTCEVVSKQFYRTKELQD